MLHERYGVVQYRSLRTFSAIQLFLFYLIFYRTQLFQMVYLNLRNRVQNSEVFQHSNSCFKLKRFGTRMFLELRTFSELVQFKNFQNSNIQTSKSKKKSEPFIQSSTFQDSRTFRTQKCYSELNFNSKPFQDPKKLFHTPRFFFFFLELNTFSEKK